MDKTQAFEIVSKIVYDRAVQLVISGNPAFDSELVLAHLEMVLVEWGYKSALVAEYHDSLKQENDNFRAMGIH
ncbi:hypothetical protein [Acinetobacter sp. YH16032]|uniref:hypothetical protein n=1 Tax=Acinetobacter sp. YH16032 TaxID=2601181 RepID=UPI0015D18144|nr:hypothetical protein [Acinetobacter sp. YH16032]